MVTHRRQPRGWRRQLARISQPVLAWIVAAAVLGGFALLLGVTGPGPSKTTASSPVQLPAMVGTPRTAPKSTSSRAAARRLPHRPRTIASRKTATVAAPAAPATHAPDPPASTNGNTRGNTPAVLVKYSVIGVSGGTFQGEVDIVNNGKQPLANWQIVVGLEGDNVTAVQNATGYASNGILVMQPTTSTEVVPPHGGTLHVIFAAEGSQMTPLACAFNQITCQ